MLEGSQSLVAPSGQPPAGLSAPLTVATVGYLVPARDFDGVVDSVFMRACNFRCEGKLLTLAVPGAADSPTTLVLERGVQVDFRRLFRAGDHVVRRNGCVRSEHATLDLSAALVWRPAPSRCHLPDVLVGRNLHIARLMLRDRLRRQPRARDPARPLRRLALEHACRRLHAPRAGSLAGRLIGLGEGLTPAGDDFLVGWCAGLDARTGTDTRRIRFRKRLGAMLAAQSPRTTRIAAQLLGLAAQGHFNADLLRARDALVAGRSAARVRAALDALFSVGATSGIATCAGLWSGLSVWPPARARMPGVCRR